MIKIMFIVLGELSAGELTIAYSFASRLDKQKYEMTFLVPDKHKQYLEDRGMPYIALSIEEGRYVNRLKIDKAIQQFKPDYFILSDAFTMEYAQGWSGLRFASLKKEYADIKIISLDEYEYLTAGYTIDYYGALLKKLPSLLDECDYLIRNCPLNTKRRPTPKVKDFRLFEEGLALPADEKARIREELGIMEDEKLVFITFSYWETLNVYRIPALSMLIRWMPRLIQNYLKETGKKITVVHVGHGKWEESSEDGHLRYKYFEYLSPQKFDEYLLASDLYITTNIVSITLSKAVFGLVPSLVLQNYKLINFEALKAKVDKMPEWYRSMASEVKIAYPFRASVFGWDNFLKSVLQENDYLDTFAQAELFKMSDVLAKLDMCLYDSQYIHSLKQKQQAYIDYITHLPAPLEVMDDICREENDK